MAEQTPVVVVLGALNVDLTVQVPSLPAPGETVVGTDLVRHPGGKGGNQAVAAARAGAAVRFVGAVGRDPDGAALLDGLSAEGIDVRHVAQVDAATGTALIAVAPDGQNQIAVAAGANARVARAAPVDALAAATHLLVSLEIPLGVATQAIVAARERSMEVLLNPAPARTLPPAVLDADPILVTNEPELATIGETPDREGAIRNLSRAGITRIIETRGGDGAVLHTPAGPLRVPAYAKVRVVDATGAGDTFCGVLAAWLAHGLDLVDAVRAANVAAGLSVQVAGAREGMPARDRIEAALLHQ